MNLNLPPTNPLPESVQASPIDNPADDTADIRISSELLAKAEKLAADNGITLNDLFIQVVERHLNTARL